MDTTHISDKNSFDPSVPQTDMHPINECHGFLPMHKNVSDIPELRAHFNSLLWNNRFDGEYVILAETSPENLALLIPLFESLYLRVQVLDNVELIMTAIDERSPVLLVLNLDLMGDQGYALIENLRAQKETRNLPAIFIDSSRHPINKKIAFQLQWIDYFSIPLVPNEILARVQTQLSVGLYHNRLEERNLRLQTLLQEYQFLRDAFLQDHELAQVTLESIGDGVITTDSLGYIRSLNLVAEKLTGWSSLEAIGKPSHEIFRIYNELTGFLILDPVITALRENRTVLLEEYAVLIARDGTEHPVSDSVAPIRNRQSNVIGAVLVFRDVTESRRLARHLSWQATHDALTQLLNRNEFERQVANLLQQSKHQENQSTLAYLDLDQFKVVNDTCGHAAGDELLRQLSLILKKQVKSYGILARLGGDEFGMLLPDFSLANSRKILDVVLQTIREFRFIWRDKTFNIGVSIGVVIIDKKSTDLSSVMSAADSACYAAKERGRNCIHIYAVHDQELARQRRERHWISRINQALEESRFCLYRQKITPIQKTKCQKKRHHFEILLRLIDETGSLIAPMAFIPAAERYNLMPTIDRWVISTFFRYCHSQSSSFLDHQYAINLSGTSFNDSSFMQFLQDEFARYNITPQSICFEITETAAIANLAQVADSMRHMKQLGCQFALDDFGSGMSSLTYLKNLPVDYLKLDGSFIKSIVDDSATRAMVEGFNHIAHVMGIETIAEFVENREILAVLKTLGVDYAQGHAIALPHAICK